MEFPSTRFSVSSVESSTNSSHATLQNAIIIDMGCTTDTDALSFSSHVTMTPRNSFSLPRGEVDTSPALCQTGWDGHSEASSEKHEFVTPGSPDSSRTLVQRNVFTSGISSVKDVRGRSISCGVEGTHSSLMAVIEEAHFDGAPRQPDWRGNDGLKAPNYSDHSNSLFASSMASPKPPGMMYRAPQRAATYPPTSALASVPLAMSQHAFNMPDAPQAGYLGYKTVNFPGYPDTRRPLASPLPPVGLGWHTPVPNEQSLSGVSPAMLKEKVTSTSEDCRAYSTVHLPGLSTPTDLVPKRRRPLTYTILAVLVILIILLGTALGLGVHNKDDSPSQPASSPHTRIQ